MGAWQFDLLSDGSQFFVLLLLSLLLIGWFISFFTYRYLLLCSILLLIVDIPLILYAHVLSQWSLGLIAFLSFLDTATGFGIICFFIGLIGIVVGVRRVFLNRQAEF